MALSVGGDGMRQLHPLDRPGQQEAYNRISESEARWIIAKLPTGLGKTALAAQSAVDGKRTLANVMTKSLQGQYTKYGFIELFGKGNYECLGYGQELKGLTADLCNVPKENKGMCTCHCPYPIAREYFINAEAGILNYAKFLTDRPVVNSSDNAQGFDPDLLVFDECHELADLTIAYSGLSYSWSNKRVREYIDPILIDVDDIAAKEGKPVEIAAYEAVRLGAEWLKEFNYALIAGKPTHPSFGGDVAKWRWWKRQSDKVEITLELIKTASDCWFVYADEEGITIRPKTARFHFKKLFDKCQQILLMSATIQPKHILALGIEWEEMEFIEMPNPYAPKNRPVYDLQGPAITYKSTMAERKQHAGIISQTINQFPDDWITLVLFPSKKKAEDWAEWIYQNTRRPVHLPRFDAPTDEAYQEWLEFKDNNTGAVCCSWQFWTGIDGTYLNGVICADMPFPDLSDRFELARFNYSVADARNRIASVVEQGMGRNRRGEPDHYGDGAKKFNAVVGGKKFDRLKSAFSRDFWSSVVRA